MIGGSEQDKFSVVRTELIVLDRDVIDVVGAAHERGDLLHVQRGGGHAGESNCPCAYLFSNVLDAGFPIEAICVSNKLVDAAIDLGWHRFHPLQLKLVVLRLCIDHAKHGNLLSGGAKLVRHLKDNGSAERITKQVVRSMRLDLADIGDVVRRHILEVQQSRLIGYQGLRLNAVDGLVCTHTH